MVNILFILGTRPEAIKLAPVIKEFNKYPQKFKVKICNTGQHKEMSMQILNFFGIKPDYNLNIMKKNQDLYTLTSNLVLALKEIFKIEKPDITFVQGDTTTAFCGALTSFYSKVPIAHIEAGLRSFNKYSPFPEEINRVLISHLADYHFAPTLKAKENLENEGIKENIWVVGNTVIDALFLALRKIKETGENKFYQKYNFIDFSKKIILVTGHRRENFGKPFENVCLALKEIVNSYKNAEIVFPVHLNPNVRQYVYQILKNHPRIHLLEPLDYPDLVWLLSKSYFVITDSGGIQEEAPALGKPVLVTREVTERIEAIEAGTAKLVGTSKEKIVNEALKLLTNLEEYNKMAKATNPYGDGNASQRILKIVESFI